MLLACRAFFVGWLMVKLKELTKVETKPIRELVTSCSRRRLLVNPQISFRGISPSDSLDLKNLCWTCRAEVFNLWFPRLECLWMVTRKMKVLVVKPEVTKEISASQQRHLKWYKLAKAENHPLQRLWTESSTLFLSFQVFPYCLEARNKVPLNPSCYL